MTSRDRRAGRKYIAQKTPKESFANREKRLKKGLLPDLGLNSADL